MTKRSVKPKIPKEAAAPTNSSFTETTLPLAVGSLFELNNYDVQYNVNVHGAQIDLIARSKSDPFAQNIYIEATIEYVSTEKYGKDSTKFLLLTKKEPAATLLCVSSEGFTAFVKERALESGVTALSYDELFMQFEKFAPYVERALSDTALIKLVETYEEPSFRDEKGLESASEWLSKWRFSDNKAERWVIVLGEYGTGKTSLTRVAQYRWIQEYKSDPNKPIAIRIELRNFSRVFDASGLLHHFLDTNNLAHVPINFLTHLIKTGRVILILDGYDEMAQFLNPRERRACLKALAELASDGAKGILTSRPNYFTEAEELRVFEALYASIEQGRFFVTQVDRSFIADEKATDQLLSTYLLEKYERNLQDLTPAQTEALVKRNLTNDVPGQELVLSLLQKVYRDGADGHSSALSGKPVIIAFLLEVVDELRRNSGNIDAGMLTEWQIYKLIIDHLMFRDLRRSDLNPSQRRKVLQSLAVVLSGRDNIVIDEHTFMRVIDEDFKNDLRRRGADERRARKEALFEDLRVSPTLTRASNSKVDGWVFSHNSLREFLVVEKTLESLSLRSPNKLSVPISTAMREFASSISKTEFEHLWQTLSGIWSMRGSQYALGPYLMLLWGAARKQNGGIYQALKALSSEKADDKLQISNTELNNIDFSGNVMQRSCVLNASLSELTGINFGNMILSGSDFSGSTLESVSFVNCDLTSVNFSTSLLFECDLSGANVKGADFRDFDYDSNIMLKTPSGVREILSGKMALGYLRYNGAITQSVADYYVLYHHPKFSIIEKICERLLENKSSQILGLTQKGESRKDPRFAREFADLIVAEKWGSVNKRGQLTPTNLGRATLSEILVAKDLPPQIIAFLEQRR